MNVMMHAVDAQPVTGSPEHQLAHHDKMTAIKESSVIPMPNQDATGKRRL